MVFDYSRMTYNNKWRVKRWSHGARFQTALELARRFVPQPRVMLDYGAGDGHFSEVLRGAFPDASVVAFDPSREMAGAIAKKSATDPQITAVSKKEDLRGKYDAIFCLEVLEHLQDEEIKSALDLWREMLSDKGVVVLSVPIETGLGGALKTAVRLSIGEGHIDGHSTWDVCRSLLGCRVDRGQSAYISSHIGFSHSRLKRLFLEKKMTICRTSYSPIPWAGSLNSQCFWVLNY